MTDNVEFGPEIAVDGMPDWLGEDEKVIGRWGETHWYSTSTWKKCYANPTSITAIRLPADHWAYKAIDAGFIPWGGGDAAPEGVTDVLFRGGGPCATSGTGLRWTHIGWEGDIIGYKRKVAPGSEVWDRALMNTPTPANTVTIPTMTEEEAREKAEQHCEDYEWDNGYIQALRDLGLIRPATLLDQFEAHHGGLDHNQRAILEIYQEWVEGQ